MHCLAGEYISISICFLFVSLFIYHDHYRYPCLYPYIFMCMFIFISMLLYVPLQGRGCKSKTCSLYAPVQGRWHTFSAQKYATVAFRHHASLCIAVFLVAWSCVPSELHSCFEPYSCFELYRCVKKKAEYVRLLNVQADDVSDLCHRCIISIIAA